MTWLWVIISFSAGFIVSSIINIGKMSELYDEIDDCEVKLMTEREESILNEYFRLVTSLFVSR